MKTLRLTDYLLCFNFPEKEGYDYGFNIYCLRSSSSTLIVDTAFRSQIREVMATVQVTHAVITHFHNDHVAGLMHLPEEIVVLGSPKYAETLQKDIPQQVSSADFRRSFHLGDHRLTFHPAPGHSPCSMYIDLDGEFLHAGDNLMSRYDGKRILPWVTRNSIPAHIRSLELLRGMKRDRVLLSHGPMIEGEKEVRKEIDLRLHYLYRVMDPSPGLRLSDALPDHEDNWGSHDHFTQLMEESSDMK